VESASPEGEEGDPELQAARPLEKAAAERTTKAILRMVCILFACFCEKNDARDMLSIERGVN